MKKYFSIILCLFLLFAISTKSSVYVVNSKIYKDSNGFQDDDINGIGSGGQIDLSLTILDSKAIDQYDIYLPMDYDEKDAEGITNAYSIGPDQGYEVLFEKIGDAVHFKSIGESKNLERIFNPPSRFNGCFDMVVFNYDKRKKINELSTSQVFKCMGIDYRNYDEINFSITTYNTVYDNNADFIDGRTYKWTFNKDNYEDHRIVFSVGKGKYVWYYYFRHLFYGLAIIIAIFLIVYIIVSIFKGFSNKANKI